MNTIWNPFAASSLTLRTSLSPGACSERLGRSVHTGMEGATLAQKPLSGRVTTESFSVWRRGGYAGDIKPVATGRFDSDPAGTVIPLRIAMGLKGWFVVGVWSAFSLGFGSLQVARALSDPRAPAAERAARAIEALGPPAVMLGLLGVGVLLSAWIHRKDTEEIVDVLKSALDASPGPDFRPLT